MPAWTPAPYSLPYIAGNDVLEQTPATNKAQMEKVSEYLQQIAIPPGAIQAYVGTDAPDFWLLCDGSSYDPDKLPELSGVNADFHSDGVFRVPDLRGRSPIGTGGEGVARDWSLGERWGDQKPGRHAHVLTQVQNGKGVFGSSASVPNGYSFDGQIPAVDPATQIHASALSPPDAAHEHVQMGEGLNYQPSTGVNFIIYAARPTKNVDLGKGSPITALTTRNMVETRLADPDITEEERSMLEEQLASL